MPRQAALRAEDAAVKRDLAARARTIEEYIDGKTDLLVRILADEGLGDDELAGVPAINRSPR